MSNIAKSICLSFLIDWCACIDMEKIFSMMKTIEWECSSGALFVSPVFRGYK